jgi:hypothetical protein
MPLFTAILDYAGGTYVSQLSADNPHMALGKWQWQLANEIEGDEAEAGAAFDEDDLNRIIALDGLTGVWCVSASAPQGLAIVNLIRTEAD